MMRWILAACTAAILVSQAPAPPVPKGAKFTFVSLKEKANQAYNDNFHTGTEGNTLKDIPRGDQKFGDVPFQIGDKCLQTGSKIVDKFPHSIDGIAVDAKADKLHFLHATAYGGGPNDPDSAGHCKEGTEIGGYTVHYDDKTKEKIPLVYGKDLRDWFFVADEKDPERSKVVWTGENEMSKMYSARLRIYLTTWANPHPDKKIVGVDFFSAGDTTPCAPFCLGITAESK